MEGKKWEDRANWASCFPPKNVKWEPAPDFVGVTVIDGKKYWVDVFKKLDRNRNRFVSVHIKPFEKEDS
jgi:hypothetical protein